MTSQAGQQIIAIHILPTFSRSKDNFEIKFGKLLDRNIFLQNHAENGRETDSRPLIDF